MNLKILTTCGCKCGASLTIIGSREEPRGIFGKYSIDGGKQTFYVKVTCLSSKCGLVYEADHPRFAGYFNEIAEKLFT